jgi:hypothetical protein
VWEDKSMRKQIENSQLVIKTNAYQAKNGGIFLDWGNTVIKLEKMYADNIAYDVPDFDVDSYNKHYGR